MGGNTTQPANPQYSPHWYAQEIAILRSPQGFAASRISILVAFGDYLAETDPITGNALFGVWGTRRITITGAELQEALTGSSIPVEEQQSLMMQILTLDGTLSQTADRLLVVLKQLGVFDDTAVPRLS